MKAWLRGNYGTMSAVRPLCNFKTNQRCRLIGRSDNRAFFLDGGETTRFVARLWRVATFSCAAALATMPLLTDHQKRILKSICLGRTNADIAREFGLAECTVKKLVSSILAKVGASSRTEAASLALRLQLVKV